MEKQRAGCWAGSGGSGVVGEYKRGPPEPSTAFMGESMARAEAGSPLKKEGGVLGASLGPQRVVVEQVGRNAGHVYDHAYNHSCRVSLNITLP